jgi:hypothetical protein
LCQIIRSLYGLRQAAHCWNCKGNLAVWGNHSGLAREDPKEIYKRV